MKRNYPKRTRRHPAYKRLREPFVTTGRQKALQAFRRESSFWRMAEQRITVGCMLHGHVIDAATLQCLRCGAIVNYHHTIGIL